ncbi:MAG: SIS domain-containing protein [Candidatus Latescibacterota bacterium]
MRHVAQVAEQLDRSAVERVVQLLIETREQGGRVFVLGVGGSAANAGHLVNDLRKLTGIEAYAPTDNVSELTARTNDEGWETVFATWLAGSRLRPADLVFVLSVGGGSREPAISANLVKALDYTRQVGSRVAGIVGRDGGYTAQVADVCVVVPTVDSRLVTPLTEAFQAVVWHLLVSHPALRVSEGKWESTEGRKP